MKLTAPREVTWVVALIAGLLGVLIHYRVLVVRDLAPHSFELLLGGFVLLLVAPLLKGL